MPRGRSALNPPRSSTGPPVRADWPTCWSTISRSARSRTRISDCARSTRTLAPAGLASRRGSKVSSDGGRSSSVNIPVTGCSTASGPIGTRSARSSMSWPKSPSSRVFQHAPSSGSNGWIRNSSLSHRGAISCRKKWPRCAIDIAAWRRHETSISMRRDWPASSSTPAGIATRPNKRRLPAPRRASAGSGSTAPSRIWARDGRPLDWSGSTRAQPRTAGCSLRRTVFARRCVDVIDWPAAKSF